MSFRAAFILLVLSSLGIFPGGGSFLNAHAAVFSASPSGRSIRMERYMSRRYLYLSDVARFYGMNYRIEGKKILLYSKYSRLEFKVNSRVFVFNQVTAHLSYAIFLPKKEPLISANDFTNLLDPVLRSPILPRRRIRRILIDPGHGGKDPGAQVGRVTEKQLVLQMGILLAQELRRNGYYVIMSRNRDVDVPLQSRADIARRYRVDLMISLHCNAAGDQSVRGIECYTANPRGTPSAGGNTVAKNKAASDAVVRENALLGHMMQQTLTRNMQCPDRGFRRKQFLVLRNCSIPAVLIETGFLTNKTDLYHLQTAAYQNRLVRSIASGVAAYENLLKKKYR